MTFEITDTNIEYAQIRVGGAAARVAVIPLRRRDHRDVDQFSVRIGQMAEPGRPGGLPRDSLSRPW